MLVEMADARRREAEAAGTAEPAVPALDGGDGERARKDLLAAIAARRPKRETEKDLQELHGGAGVYSADMRKNYMLEDEEWKYDIVPEIMDGKNVFDYVDPEIEERLLELEAEEEELEAEHQAAMAEAEQTAAPDMLTEEEAEELKALRKKKHDVVEEHRDRKARASNNSIVPRSADTERRSTTRRMRDSLEAMGYDAEGAVRRRGMDGRHDAVEGDHLQEPGAVLQSIGASHDSRKGVVDHHQRLRDEGERIDQVEAHEHAFAPLSRPEGNSGERDGRHRHHRRRRDEVIDDDVLRHGADEATERSELCMLHGTEAHGTRARAVRRFR